MARINLTHHRKFRRLTRALGSPALALGTLELLWLAAYEAADPVVGGALDVAEATAWPDSPDALVRLLVEYGFLDTVAPDLYAVHDLWDHAPDYVKKRWCRAHPGKPAPWRTPDDDPHGGQNPPNGGQRTPSGEQTPTASRHTTALPVPSRPVPARPVVRAAPRTAPSPSNGGKPVEKDPPNPRVITRLAYELPPELEAADEGEKKAALKDLAVRYGCAYDAPSITGALDHRARTTAAAPRRAAMRAAR